MVKERYKNLCKKYGITVEDLAAAIEQLNLGEIACDGSVLIALCELIASGDISDGN